MAKKRRRSAPAAETPAHIDESEIIVRDEEMLRDEIDEELMGRNVIRFDDDSEDVSDDDLQTEDILELPSEEDEEEEEEDLRERDFEEIEDELRVTDKAWGKKKAVYYKDNEEERGSSEEEEEMDAEEEREAMVLQKRLMSNLTPEDFETSRFAQALPDNESSVVRRDVSLLGQDEQLMYLLENSPELPEMLEEFRDKLTEAREPLYPLLQLGRQKGTFSDTGHSYIEAKYKLNLLYCLNIGYYLMLQSSTSNKQEIKEHPVIQRILSIRNMYKLCAKTDYTLEREIEKLLNVDGKEETENVKKRTIPQSDSAEDEGLYEKYAKKSEERKQKKKKKKKGIEILPEDPTIMKEEGDNKRGITYKIMKNKGLTPHRKKEQRNPRVKYRKKFDKALKKRRSQIPDHRKQEGSYGGEKTGIKSGLTKSTMLK